jgi:hypothetical protein
LGIPDADPYSSVMPPRAPSGQFRLPQAAWPYVRVLVFSALPVPDLLSRRRVRRVAYRLTRECDPWPGMAASGTDAARLALLRLLYLQKAIHGAVRSRQDEAATMLARVAIETYITGMYCLYEPDAVAHLQNGALKTLGPMLEFLSGAIDIPRDVLDQCIRRLNAGTPAQGPTVRKMAERVDAATGAAIAISLYNRYYRPTSNLALHAGAASLTRHVRGDGRITRRPSRVWGRRAPARIADACMGGLTAYLAHREDKPWRHVARYADRHHERAVPPIAAISIGNLGRGLRPGQVRQIVPAIGRVRALGQYVQSGQDNEDPEVRTGRIRAELEAFLTIPGLDVSPGTLDPYLDFLAAKIVAEGTASEKKPALPAGPKNVSALLMARHACRARVLSRPWCQTRGTNSLVFGGARDIM